MRAACYTFVFAILIFLAEVSVTSFAEDRLAMPPEYRVDNLPQGCLVSATGFEAHAMRILRGERVWTRLIRITFTDGSEGHAVCVYSLPRSRLIWSYDSLHGSVPLLTKSRRIEDIQSRLQLTYFPHLKTATFID